MAHDEVHITIDISGFEDLPVASVWPDGDAPPVITADAVVAAMREAGITDAGNLINDWLLTADVLVTVNRPNPLAGQLRLDGSEEPDTVTESAYL